MHDHGYGTQAAGNAYHAAKAAPSADYSNKYAPQSGAPPVSTSLAGVLDTLSIQINRLHDVVAITRAHADSLCGEEPPLAGGAVEAPSYPGVLGSIRERLDIIDGLINLLCHHNGRIGRALNGS